MTFSRPLPLCLNLAWLYDLLIATSLDSDLDRLVFQQILRSLARLLVLIVRYHIELIIAHHLNDIDCGGDLWRGWRLIDQRFYIADLSHGREFGKLEGLGRDPGARVLLLVFMLGRRWRCYLLGLPIHTPINFNQ